MATRHEAGPSGPASSAERRSEKDGSAEAFWDPHRRAFGHLDANGEFVKHEAPEGFRHHGPDGHLAPVEPEPVKPEKSEERNG